MKVNINELTTDDLFCIEGFDSYRAICKDAKQRAEADRIFEETKDLKAVDEFCKKILKRPFINKLLEESNIDKRFQLRTLENYIPETDVLKKAKNQVDEYIENIEENKKTGTNLILAGFGCVGTGKTHLACAIAHKVTAKDISVKFINVTSMVEEMKETFKTTDYIRVDFLIIDDLGKENGTSWVCEQIYSIINKRYEAMKPTIITTEGTIDDLKKNYGNRGNAIISRLIENFILVKLTGNDYRKKKVREIYNGKYD